MSESALFFIKPAHHLALLPVVYLALLNVRGRARVCIDVHRRELFAGRRNLSRESILNGETPTPERRCTRTRRARRRRDLQFM